LEEAFLISVLVRSRVVSVAAGEVEVGFQLNEVVEGTFDLVGQVVKVAAKEHFAVQLQAFCAMVVGCGEAECHGRECELRGVYWPRVCDNVVLQPVEDVECDEEHAGEKQNEITGVQGPFGAWQRCVFELF